MTSSLARDRVIFDSSGPGMEMFLGSLESFIMESFWEHGESTIQDLADRALSRGYRMSYTTMSSVVEKLVVKGFVRVTRKTKGPWGNPRKRYVAVHGKEDLLRILIGKMIDALQKNYDQVLYEVWDQLVEGGTARI